jgi:Zn-dependent protease
MPLNVQDPLALTFFVLYWVVFVYSMVLHEVAHGYSSYRLGDPTAWKAGRLTLNPLRHIDPVFSILLPIVFWWSTGVPFGGAKPVPVNPFLYRNLRWGSLITAAAGPLTNLVLGFLCAGLLYLSVFLAHGDLTLTGRFLFACLILNVMLACFNLLPIPPLDGSHILASLLPRDLQEIWGRVQALGWLPLMILIAVDRWVPLISKPLVLFRDVVLHLMGLR